MFILKLLHVSTHIIGFHFWKHTHHICICLCLTHVECGECLLRAVTNLEPKGRIPLFYQAANLAASLAFDLRERVESTSKASCKLA